MGGGGTRGTYITSLKYGLHTDDAASAPRSMGIGGGAGKPENTSGLMSRPAGIMIGTSCLSNPQRKHIVPLAVSHTGERNKLPWVGRVPCAASASPLTEGDF